jgi:hypothetical protein
MEYKGSTDRPQEFLFQEMQLMLRKGADPNVKIEGQKGLRYVLETLLDKKKADTLLALA